VRGDPRIRVCELSAGRWAWVRVRTSEHRSEPVSHTSHHRGKTIRYPREKRSNWGLGPAPWSSMELLSWQLAGSTSTTTPDIPDPGRRPSASQHSPQPT
jgi:hypothetical protein